MMSGESDSSHSMKTSCPFPPAPRPSRRRRKGVCQSSAMSRSGNVVITYRDG